MVFLLKNVFMKNVYHSDIMQLLLLKGKEGMHVSEVSRMVFNLHTNFFDRRLNYQELHQMIRMYLWRQSRLRRSPFMRVSYGVYAVKPDLAVQLDFCFDQVLDDDTVVQESRKETAGYDPYTDPRQMKLFD